MNEEQSKIAVGVITELTKDAIKSISSRIKKYYNDSEEKDAIDFGDAYEKYIKISSNMQDKNFNIS